MKTIAHNLSVETTMYSPELEAMTYGILKFSLLR